MDLIVDMSSLFRILILFLSVPESINFLLFLRRAVRIFLSGRERSSFMDIPVLFASFAIIFFEFPNYSPVLSNFFGNKKSKQNPNHNFMRTNILKCVHSIYTRL